MSEEIIIGMCMECFKPITVNDKEFYAVPVKKRKRFAYNKFYHIKCYKNSEGKKDE